MRWWTAVGRSNANGWAQLKRQSKAIRYGTLLAAGALAFLSLEALADPSLPASSVDKEADTVKANGKFEPFKSESKPSTGSVTIGGQTIAYQAIAGTMIVHPKGWDDVPHDPKAEKDQDSSGDEGKNKNPTAEASMFYVAYFKTRRTVRARHLPLQWRSGLRDRVAAHGSLRAAAYRHLDRFAHARGALLARNNASSCSM